MISLIVLAAGQSRRMGTNKLALPWGHSTVLESTLAMLSQTKASQKILVLGHEAGRWRHLENLPGWNIIASPQYAMGQSHSLQAGLAQLAPECQGILFCLGDVPLLQKETVNRIIDVYQENSIPLVAPVYQGRRGNPVLFAADLLPELRELKGDTGARELFHRHSHILVPVDDPGVVIDIDTPEEYEKWKNAEIRGTTAFPGIPKGCQA